VVRRHPVGMGKISPTSPDPFGPVAPITAVRNDEEALALPNATEYGPTTADVSADLARAQRAAEGLHSGVVHINDQTVGVRRLWPDRRRRHLRQRLRP
jgi:acyl-CoA reductase-like NAD-dependent aldehyde dehydrogenase